MQHTTVECQGVSKKRGGGGGVVDHQGMLGGGRGGRSSRDRFMLPECGKGEGDDRIIRGPPGHVKTQPRRWMEKVRRVSPRVDMIVGV